MVRPDGLCGFELGCGLPDLIGRRRSVPGDLHCLCPCLLGLFAPQSSQRPKQAFRQRTGGANWRQFPGQAGGGDEPVRVRFADFPAVETIIGKTPVRAAIQFFFADNQQSIAGRQGLLQAVQHRFFKSGQLGYFRAAQIRLLRLGFNDIAERCRRRTFTLGANLFWRIHMAAPRFAGALLLVPAAPARMNIASSVLLTKTAFPRR